jgi:hypothetical protein
VVPRDVELLQRSTPAVCKHLSECCGALGRDAAFAEAEGREHTIAHKSPAEASDSLVSYMCGAEIEMLKFTDVDALPRSEKDSER